MNRLLEPSPANKCIATKEMPAHQALFSAPAANDVGIPEIVDWAQYWPQRGKQGRRDLGSCWCERGDSNPHGFTRQILSLVRLPIPPLSRLSFQLYTASRFWRVATVGTFVGTPAALAEKAALIATCWG